LEVEISWKWVVRELAVVAGTTLALAEAAKDGTMMTNMFDSSPLPVLEQVVKFTEARHGVLAGNLANLDTPGYRVRDLPVEEFQSQLKEAVEERQRQPISQAPSPALPASPGNQITTTSSWQKRPGDKLASVAENAKGMLRHDENNSSLEEQVSEMSKNQAEFNMAVSLMNAQFRMLRAAITERA
jgi:flagellar basal-body rod protein FlgB